MTRGRESVAWPMATVVVLVLLLLGLIFEKQIADFLGSFIEFGSVLEDISRLPEEVAEDGKTE